MKKILLFALTTFILMILLCLCSAAIMYGDCNGDGKINGKDLIRLRKYLTAYDNDLSAIEYKPNMDCNGDGKIDGKDLIRLRKYFSNYNDDTGVSDISLGYDPTLDEYVITWMNYDGTILKTDVVKYGTLPSYSGTTPERESDASYYYTFKGWGPTIEKVKRNATYLAQYSKYSHDSFNIKYDANGGTEAPDPQIKFKGKSIDLSTDIPTNDDHVFMGWACGNDGHTYSAGSEFSIDADATLYAIWGHNCENCHGAGSFYKEERCTACEGEGRVTILTETLVICNSCNGKGKITTGNYGICTVCNGYGSLYVCYCSCGNAWYLHQTNSKKCSQCGVAVNPTYVKSCETCCGKGVIEPVTTICSSCSGSGYKYTYSYNTSICQCCNGTGKRTVQTICSVCQGKKQIKEYPASCPITLYNDESVFSIVNVNQNEPFLLSVPTRNGYDFIGWYDSPYGGIKYTNEAGVSLSIWNYASRVNLYAQWRLKYYTITYDCDNLVNLGDLPTVFTVEDSNIVLLQQERENYYFHWEVDDNVSYEVDTSLAKDILVKGIWTSFYDRYFDYVKRNDGTWEIKAASVDEMLSYVVIPREREGIPVTAISEYAFFDCSEITDIIIPDTILSIGKSAFYGCSGISTLIIPDSVTYIGKGALEKCNNLNYIETPLIPYSNSFGYLFGCSDYRQNFVYVPSSLKTVVIYIPNNYISSYAFYGCNNISEIIIKNYFSNINDHTFCNCSSLTRITIPDSVTSIGDDAFSDCSSLMNITIPDSVTSIGGCAFYDCRGLTSITIPDSVTSVGNSAFMGCSELTSITMGNNVTIIGDHAFRNCSNLTEITIPNSVTSIGKGVISGCIRLTKINVASGNIIYFSKGNCIIEKDNRVLIAGCENSDIPNGIISIGSEAFSHYSNLMNITIPDSVMSIGDYAFSGCSGLTSITIPDGVTSIGNYAFSGCSGLTNASIGSGVTNIGDSAFYKCTGLTSITIPDSVTSIGDRAFYACSGLTNASIGSGVANIGEYAFYNCTGLTSIPIPGGVTSIGGYAFSGCSGLTNASIGSGVANIGEYAFYNCTGLTSITIPDSVTSIGNRAFYACSGLTNIAIGSGVVKLTASFNLCQNLTNITVSRENANYYSSNNCLIEKSSQTLILGCKTSIIPNTVKNIAGEAFYYCDGLLDITIPDSVTSIGGRAFYNCASLRSLTVGKNVTNVNSEAFYRCDNLCLIINYSDLNIICGSQNYGYLAYYAVKIINKDGSCSYRKTVANEKYIETSDDFVFIQFSNGCYTLIAYIGNKKSVILPNNINGNSYGIQDMRGVINIIIPNTISKIDAFAFRGCNSLSTVIIPDSVTSIGESAFSGCSSLSNIALPDGLKIIGLSAFSGCSSLTSVTIPDGVTSIGDRAFSGCSGLQYNEYDNALYLGNDNNPYVVLIKANNTSISNVEINENTKIIYEGAFNGCSCLTNIIIPDSVTSIGGWAFQNCNSLMNITISDNVTNIGKYAFYQCSSLMDVNIGKGVMSIGDHAFYKCSSLETIIIPETVIQLGEYAFSYSGITSANIGCIGKLSFAYCDNLKNVTISDSVTVINTQAFLKCSNLKSITIPDCVINIETAAFGGCSSLENVIIGNGVKRIGQHAFYGCDNLNSVVFENPNGWKAGGVNLSATKLIDPITAALYLRDDNFYGLVTWMRS